MRMRWSIPLVVSVLLGASGCMREERTHSTSLNSAAQLNSQEFLLRTNDLEGELFLLNAQDVKLTRVSGGPREIPRHDWSLSTVPGNNNVVSFYSRAQFYGSRNEGEILLFGINGDTLVPKYKFAFPQPGGALADLVWLDADLFLLVQSLPETSDGTAPIQIGIGTVAAQFSGQGEELELMNTTLYGTALSLTRCSNTTALLVTCDPDGRYSSLRLSVENMLKSPKLEVEQLPGALSNGPVVACAALSSNVLLTVAGKSEKTISLLTLWDTTTWQEVSSARLGFPIQMGVLAVSPNAKLAAAKLESEQTIAVFDTASGRIISEIPVENRRDRKKLDLEAVVAEVDPNYRTTGLDRKVCFWR